MTAKPASNGTARRGMVVAPERRASEAGLSVLLDGGTAIEAAIATAAVLGVTYPHMTGIGGDAFWLIHRPGQAPIAITGCGSAGAVATLDLYHGHDRIPSRGPIAANTVAGAVSSWKAALGLEGASRLGLPRLLRDAIAFAGDGAEIAPNLERNIAAKDAELRSVPGWSDVFGEGGKTLALPHLAHTLEQLGANGLGSFYSGPLARDIAADLAEVGAPLSADDLAAHKSTIEIPLSVRLRDCDVYNAPPPTQGFASLVILALADRLPAATESDFAYIHSLVEATKLAFAIRNREIGDPAFMSFDCQKLLDDTSALARMASSIDPARATPWPRSHGPGDTVWIGAADSDGCVVSMIQSIFFEFGSGVIMPRTGILWQNRGSSFRLAPDGWNALMPGRKPFHTLNPALARFDDGRVMAYGTMGGEGQPQTQAALFTRYARRGTSLINAIDAPRWLLGRTWGDETTALRLESRFDNKAIDALRNAGHPVQMVEDYSDLMGHAGAIVRHA
ncbi:MAG: gamma-glutamyltransferase, partial [Novosphingobium sp.]|nr:gamma-glutamyltransferase [Novosphingobium sp.]